MKDVRVIPSEELYQHKKVKTLEDIQKSSVIIINGMLIPITKHHKIDPAHKDPSVIMTKHPGGYSLDFLLSQGRFEGENDVRLVNKEEYPEYFL